jgi:signal transduction histidine kinase
MNDRAAGPRRKLRNRLMLAFAGFTLLVATVFGLYVAVFAYSVEDLFFQAALEREAAVQRQHHDRSGQWTTPRESWIVVVEDAADLPDGIAGILRDEPARTEFPGVQGRHYHLLALQPAAVDTQTWLLAEVGEQLIVRPRRASLVQLLAGTGAAMVALALLLGWWLARRTTAPLSRLADLVEQATPERLPPAFARGLPNDEVGALARGLEALIVRVRAFIEREREFTRDASHELRTPLAVIRSTTERLQAEPGQSEATRQGLAHLQHSAAQLEQTVAMLLALARERAVTTDGTPVAVLPILERIVVEQSPLLDGKDIAVEVDVSPMSATTLPAPVLRVLLSNLVGNAFAHTVDGTVRIDVAGGRLRIANPGAGIRDVDFDPHVKGEASAGFGLGLAIVRRLCERYGLDLRIEPGPVDADLHGAGSTIASLALGGPEPESVA